MMTVILIFYVGIAEAEEVPAGKGNSSNQGSTSNDGNSSRLPKQNGRRGQHYRIPKPERDRRSESRARQAKKPKKKNRAQKNNRADKADAKRKKAKSQKVRGITDVITKQIGSAIILKHYIEKMGIIEIVDRLVPTGPGRKISHGEMVAGLMETGLDDFHPRPQLFLLIPDKFCLD